MTITPTKLRQNIFKLLDKVAATGEPLEIKRKGIKLKIISVTKKNKLKSLKKRKILNCSPEKIIHNNWEKEWKQPSI